jgi:hypothetical protein
METVNRATVFSPAGVLGPPGFRLIAAADLPFRIALQACWYRWAGWPATWNGTHAARKAPGVGLFAQVDQAGRESPGLRRLRKPTRVCERIARSVCGLAACSQVGFSLS